MRMFSVKKMVGAVVACGLMMAYTASPAQAAFVLQVSDGVGNSATIADNGAAVYTGSASGFGDLSGLSGLILWTGDVGNFTINVDTGTSKPIVGDAQTGALDLTYRGKTVRTGGTLTMTLSDTGFTAGVPMLGGDLSQSIGGTQDTNDDTTLQGWKDLNNCEMGAVGCVRNLVTPGQQLFTPNAFSGGATVAHGPVISPYAMILRVRVIGTGGDVVGFSGNAVLTNSPVPEPGSMALLGSGLLFLARQARRRYGKRS